MTFTTWSIGVESPITPSEELPAMPEVEPGGALLIEGRAPIWRYGQAFHKAHGSAAGSIWVFDPRLGAVCIATHVPGVKKGQVEQLTD